MTSSLYLPRLDPFKRCSKLIAKRFAVKLSYAQEALSRASGFESMNQMIDSMKMANEGDTTTDLSGVSQDVWSRRLFVAFGDDLPDLFPRREQEAWWLRIHGPQGLLYADRWPEAVTGMS